MKPQIISAALATALILFMQSACKDADSRKRHHTDTTFTIRFNPFPPKDLAPKASPRQLVEFAWEEFLALNWKASYDKDSKRDMPDNSWSYYADHSAYPDLNVWETYAHRSELRPWSNHILPFDDSPHYSYDPAIVVQSEKGNSFSLFDNLDENNEIGSCNLYAHVDRFGKQYQVLYQAKVNRDEYEYILRNYPDSNKLAKASHNTRNNIRSLQMYYPGGGDNSCDCPDSVICLPCGGVRKPNSKDTFTGTIEIKSAWRELIPGIDDTARFFRRNVIVYNKESSTSKIRYTNKVYGLVGLHIIHKTQNYPDFVFATFEQEDVTRDHMGYYLIDSHGMDSGQVMTPQRSPIQPVTEASTRYVHSKLPKTSVWQHYRLVGVQATPTEDTASFSFFLSNYAVESDYTLSHFQGSGIDSPHNQGKNILYHGEFLSQGGCQGCHGVAQKTLGTDFSFLLDSGNGKPTRVPDTVGTAKLQTYIRTIRLAQKRVATE